MYYVGNGEIIATSEAYESKTSQAPMFSAFSQRSEASAVVQRELGAALCASTFPFVIEVTLSAA